MENRLQILSQAVQHLSASVKADRVLAVFDGQGYVYGFAPGSLWDMADLSQGLLEDLISHDQAALIPDALLHPVFVQRTSALLSNIAAVIFVPLRDHGRRTRGFLYLDQNRQNNVPLVQPVLDRILAYAKDTLEPALHALVPPLSWDEALKTEWTYPPEPEAPVSPSSEHRTTLRDGRPARRPTLSERLE